MNGLIPFSQPELQSPDKAALITQQAARLLSDFNLGTVTASEIEFFLAGADGCPNLRAFWDRVGAASAESGLAIHKTGKEDGYEQFEISIKPCPDPLKTVTNTITLKAIVTEAAAACGMTADFSAKPYADRPGNGLHIHVHLTDKNGKNVFFKSDESISSALQYSIGGLMVWINPCMPVFAPKAECYARFAAKSTAPLTISWGGNNRTVAIRLPDAAHDNKHIEHRVPGADADPALVMAVTLAAVHFGIANRCDPGQQMWGDASLPMYNLPPIARTLEDALARMHDSKVFEGYFSVSDLLPAR